jgi:predicted RNase H-like nuclease (RuvC/YqgF family)
MYNEHFQYPQYGNPSSFPYDSISRPSPLGAEPTKSSYEGYNVTSSNAQII